METTNNPNQNNSPKSRLYFIIAIILLFVLALMWSVDGSFFYLISGPVVFFFYLGFRSLPSAHREERYQNQQYRQGEFKKSNDSSSFAGAFTSFFRRKQAESRSYTAKPSQVPSSKRFLLIGVVIFMFAMFLIPMLVTLFGSDENTNEYFFTAEQFYSSQSYDSAYVNYEKAIREDPTDAEAFVGLGNTAFDMNRLDSALTAYNQALAINPDISEVQYKKGLIFYYQKKYDQAAQTLTSLFEKDPTYFDALLKLGDVYYDQKRYDDALKYYDQAYANGVRSNWICYVSGYLYEEKGNTKKAISLYKEALSYDSTVVDIYARLGTLIPGSDGDFFRRKAAEGGQQ